MASFTSIHDTNLLIWALEGLASGIAPAGPLLDRLKGKIEDRQAKWGLTEREAEHQRLVEMALQELEVLGLYERGTKSVTDEGRHLLHRMQKEKGRAPIIEYLAPRLLSGFDDVDAFLCLLAKRGDIKIPRVPGKRELGLEVGHRGRKKADVETPEALQAYIDVTFERVKQYLPDPGRFKERAAYWQSNSRGKRHYDVVRTIIRDAALADFEYGDVKYKVVRDRLWYLGIVNWSEHLPEFEGEICYSIYKQDQSPADPERLHLGSCIGPLSVAIPGKAQAAFNQFVRELWTRFGELSRRTVGYVPIPDLRDAYCRALRISDYAFNDLFRRFARACSEDKVPFICNWETADIGEITQKRLPIEVPGIGIRKAVAIQRIG